MRKDMSKLLCERPRINSGDRDKDREGRCARSHSRDLELVYDEDDEGDFIESNSPKHMKMGKGWRGHGTKELNENLKPLYGWLDKQAGRPWDKVYSELREQISTKSAVQMHIMQHLWSYVERHAEVVDGKVYSMTKLWYGRNNELRSGDLYVHPENGLLCKYKCKKEVQVKPEPVLREVNNLTYLCKINGLWYKIQYSQKPSKEPLNRRYNYLKNEWVDEWDLGEDSYTKKQLSNKMLRKYKLVNDHD